ncbi:MAG: rRNA methylase [Candidatus Nanosalina sp. J07AB43]|nr:MAG: rRNA methylase [Candidatus Nanosalina sp. J07AB43]
MNTLVLVEPEIPENTGFIARLCENFEFDLRIVNPEFNLEEARKTASNAQQKIRDVRIYEETSDAIEDLDFVVGTKPGRGISLQSFEPRSDTSIMVGRESSGLTNEELELCDAIVHIQTGGYDSLNQSHAASILMHRFFVESKQKGINQGQIAVLDSLIQQPKLKELVLRSNPSKGELEHLLGQLKD